MHQTRAVAVGFQAWVLAESLQSRRCPPLRRLSPGSRGPWRAAWDAHPARIGPGTPPASTAGPQPAAADRPSPPRRLAAANRQGIADPVVVVGSTPVVVGPVVGGSVLVVVARVVVVVGMVVVVGAVVGG